MTVQPPRVKVKKGQDAVFRCDVTEDGRKAPPGKFAIRWATSGNTGADKNDDDAEDDDDDADDSDGLFASGDDEDEGAATEIIDGAKESTASASASASVVTFNDTLVISNVNEFVEGDVTCFVIKINKETADEEEEEEDTEEYVGRASARLDVIGMNKSECLRCVFFLLRV